MPFNLKKLKRRLFPTKYLLKELFTKITNLEHKIDSLNQTIQPLSFRNLKDEKSIEVEPLLKDISNNRSEIQTIAVQQLANEFIILEDLERDLLNRFPTLKPNIKSFIQDYKEFLPTGITSEQGYQTWRQLFFLTQGMSNELIHNHLAFRSRKPSTPDSVSSAFGHFSSQDIHHAANVLRKDGIFQFPTPLPKELINDLREKMDDRASQNNRAGYLEYPEDCRTYYRKEIVSAIPEVRKLASDPFIYYTVGDYFGMPPILSWMHGWNSRPHNNSNDALSASAQAFHVDMSNPKFVQVFIYLKDVTEKNGPHCFIPKTHRQRAKELYEDRRVFDEEMDRYHARETWLNQTGPAGTAFIVDTSAYHKGLALVEGERRVLVFYLADTLFGQYYPHDSNFPKLFPHDFENDVGNYSPRFFQRYLIPS